MRYVLISHEKIDIESCINKVKSDSAGAISSFIGTTRDEFNGKKVIKLEYEAYESMALSEINKVCDTIESKYNDIKHIVIIHRIGDVPVGESSIVIFISSAHRSSSLEAVHYAIDTIKSIAPIWKKEYYSDGSIWKGNCESCHYH
ncbi:hypothetical protein CYY_004338 [Polysphondylium violaceum]|uniref:Molybdopterin synthase catalytic subunit n=1 Tax=Polysphondylium violaceum TaxID=133409 RepID=A0A8J4PVC1_9MYCE|nr:hypothetical protein CYY_004338 [Polysphondylium violaceum]